MSRWVKEFESTYEGSPGVSQITAGNYFERGWQAALDAVLEIRCDNAQFSLPKWIKDEIEKLRSK